MILLSFCLLEVLVILHSLLREAEITSLVIMVHLEGRIILGVKTTTVVEIAKNRKYRA